MRNYEIVNDYIAFDFGLPTNLQVFKNNKNNLFYMTWKDDTTTICFDHSPSTPISAGYSKVFKEAFVYEFNDVLWYK